METIAGSRLLGRTGLRVGRMGLSASYGVPGECVETALDHGINYLYWGSIRRDAFGQALRRLAPRRDEYVLVIQSYSRIASLVGWSLERALRKIGTDHTDVLLLGMWNRPLSPRILDACLRLRERGLVRHLALSTHKRVLVPELAAGSPFDVLHFRYNAVHAGAERDIFPHLPPEGSRPGLVAFTATSWKQLLDPKNARPGRRAPTAEDCYRFVLSQPDVDCCLSGPANTLQFQDVLGALAKGPMDEDEIAWMREVGSVVYRTKGSGFFRG